MTTKKPDIIAEASKKASEYQYDIERYPVMEASVVETTPEEKTEMTTDYTNAITEAREALLEMKQGGAFPIDGQTATQALAKLDALIEAVPDGLGTELSVFDAVRDGRYSHNVISGAVSILHKATGGEND